MGFFVGATLFVGAGTGMAQAANLSQPQIQSIMSLLQSFAVDQTTLNTVYAALTGSAVSSQTYGSCLQLQFDLSYGSTDAQTNGEVSKLQAFLGLQPSGYFGSYTRQYVANFQSQHGISTVGAVGPQTRAAMAQSTCNGGTTVGSSYFTLGMPFTLYVGQQTTEASLGQLQIELTSTAGNTAQVALSLACARNTQCFYSPQQTVAIVAGQQISFQGYNVTLTMLGASSATFTVTGGQTVNSSFYASPTSGQTPLTVNFSGAVSQNGSYIIDYGDGQNSGQLTAVQPPCASSAACTPQVQAVHVYQSAGTYTATLSPYISCMYSTPRCMIAVQNIGQVTVTATGQTIGGLTITQPYTGAVFTRGQDMQISWNYPVTPGATTNMVLDLYTAAGSKVGTIAVSGQTTGSYTWHIPGFPQTYLCTMQYPNGLCGTNIPTGQYFIVVSATSGGVTTTSNLYAAAQSGLFTINQQ